MKREVASSLVERGVSERVRLTQGYEKKRDELQRQHELVRTALAEHKAKVSTQLNLSNVLNLKVLMKRFQFISFSYVWDLVLSLAKFVEVHQGRRRSVAHFCFENVVI